ncbi:MAG: hypothetical protein U1E53_05125 [Dongiaceae bacterium]
MSKIQTMTLIALASIGMMSMAPVARADDGASQHAYQENRALRDIATLHRGDDNVNQTASRPVQSAAVPGVAGCVGPAAACNPAQ